MSPQRRTAFALAVLGAVVSGASAQTTGRASLNDYTIDGLHSQSTSCTPVALPGGGSSSFAVETQLPGQLVVLLFSFEPCAACTLEAFPTSCPLPFTACGGVTNHSLDLSLGSPWTVVTVGASLPDPQSTGGLATVALPIPDVPLAGSTQAAVFGTLCPDKITVLLSQAYDFSVSAGP